jgi:hypothetical protein
MMETQITAPGFDKGGFTTSELMETLREVIDE